MAGVGTLLVLSVKEARMPFIQVDGPPVDVNKKRELARRLTDVAMDIYKIPHITIIIRENSKENVASDGELIADRHDQDSAGS